MKTHGNQREVGMRRVQGTAPNYINGCIIDLETGLFQAPIHRIEPIVLANLEREKLRDFMDMYETHIDEQWDMKPILLDVHWANEYWRLEDGRHRTLGALMAGRITILARLQNIERWRIV